MYNYKHNVKSKNNSKTPQKTNNNKFSSPIKSLSQINSYIDNISSLISETQSKESSLRILSKELSKINSNLSKFNNIIDKKNQILFNSFTSFVEKNNYFEEEDKQNQRLKNLAIKAKNKNLEYKMINNNYLNIKDNIKQKEKKFEEEFQQLNDEEKKIFYIMKDMISNDRNIEDLINGIDIIFIENSKEIIKDKKLLFKQAKEETKEKHKEILILENEKNKLIRKNKNKKIIRSNSNPLCASNHNINIINTKSKTKDDINKTLSLKINKNELKIRKNNNSSDNSFLSHSTRIIQTNISSEERLKSNENNEHRNNFGDIGGLNKTFYLKLNNTFRKYGNTKNYENSISSGFLKTDRNSLANRNLSNIINAKMFFNKNTNNINKSLYQQRKEKRMEQQSFLIEYNKNFKNNIKDEKNSK